MTETDEILRIAAKGDGVTASGRFVAGSAPGDLLMADGTLQHGPHHIAPACRHFGTCGGCQLQQLDDASLADFVSERVANAATGQGLTPARIVEPYLSPPASRRRAALRAESKGGRILLGYREARSHKLVDLAECPVLLPSLVAQIQPIRKLLARQGGKIAADIELAEVEQGVDLAIKGLTVEGLAATEAMLEFARTQGLARLTLDQGYGAEALWEPEPVTVALGGISVGYPSGAFLQATADGEAALVAAAREWLGGAATVADLFSGLGTFALALEGPAKLLSVEAARDAHMAC
jgi:23S rRNA (uracil1939-C5)-methyltransferase